MTQICASGTLNVDTATAYDLAAMQSATMPVDTLLEQDPSTKQAILEINGSKPSTTRTAGPPSHATNQIVIRADRVLEMTDNEHQPEVRRS